VEVGYGEGDFYRAVFVKRKRRIVEPSQTCSAVEIQVDGEGSDGAYCNGSTFFASLGCAQESANFEAASTNVWGADYPRVDSAGRAEFRVKAPDATKVRLDFGVGPM